MFLRACVVDRRNILVSGGTGTGKTTFLNVLSSFVPFKERIVTIEDTTELRLHQEHVVTLESKPANVEGAGDYTIRDLVKNALRMRPDRVIVGECRGGEALDMIQAMNTGHDGSMTTVHANSAGEVIERLEVLMLMAADLPMISIHRQIASALDMIVHINRLPAGPRRDADLRGRALRSGGQADRDSTSSIFATGSRCGRRATCRRSSTRWWRRNCWTSNSFTARDGQAKWKITRFSVRWAAC